MTEPLTPEEIELLRRALTHGSLDVPPIVGRLLATLDAAQGEPGLRAAAQKVVDRYADDGLIHDVAHEDLTELVYILGEHLAANPAPAGLDVHGYTCGQCSWGRGTIARSQDQYEAHRASTGHDARLAPAAEEEG